MSHTTKSVRSRVNYFMLWLTDYRTPVVRRAVVNIFHVCLHTGGGNSHVSALIFVVTLLNTESTTMSAEGSVLLPLNCDRTHTFMRFLGTI